MNRRVFLTTMSEVVLKLIFFDFGERVSVLFFFLFSSLVKMSLVTLGKDSKKAPKLRRIERQREPKVIENVKTAMFIKGSQASAQVASILRDLVPNCCKLTILVYVEEALLYSVQQKK